MPYLLLASEIVTERPAGVQLEVDEVSSVVASVVGLVLPLDPAVLLPVERAARGGQVDEDLDLAADEAGPGPELQGGALLEAVQGRLAVLAGVQGEDSHLSHLGHFRDPLETQNWTMVMVFFKAYFRMLT